MQKNTGFKFRVLAILALMVFLVVPMIAVSAQDDDGYDDDYYDDEYYDDDYYDDDYYDDDEGYDDAGGDDEEALASYEIDGVELLGNPEGEHIDLWDSFVEVIPEEYLDRFVTFEIIAGEETLGYVYIDEDDEERYVLALSLTLLDEEDELVHTNIHEFGHTVTLNYEQVDGEISGTCPTFELEEGCSDEESYIYAFYSAYYEDGDNTDEDDFVTEYASENIAEDMAESFTFFILEDDMRDGDSIADDKVNFFYGFPELVEMRDAIREEIED